MVKDFLVLGNWKENKTDEEALEWAKIVSSKLAGVKNVQIAICPPYIFIPDLKRAFEGSILKLGAQDVSEFEKGTYTGEISVDMLKGMVDYVVVGHSERRKTFKETNKLISQKVKQVLSHNLIPVVCIADKVDEEGIPQSADAIFSEATFMNQIMSVYDGLTGDEQKKIILSFEPPAAISAQVGGITKGEAAKIEEVEPVINKIKTLSNNAKVLYGGSVKSDNVLEFFQSKLIDGVMPGSASLNADEFVKLVLRIEEANQ